MAQASFFVIESCHRTITTELYYVAKSMEHISSLKGKREAIFLTFSVGYSIAFISDILSALFSTINDRNSLDSGRKSSLRFRYFFDKHSLFTFTMIIIIVSTAHRCNGYLLLAEAMLGAVIAHMFAFRRRRWRHLCGQCLCREETSGLRVCGRF